MHDLKIGQKGVLVFTLDNRKETVLSKKVLIRPSTATGSAANLSKTGPLTRT